MDTNSDKIKKLEISGDGAHRGLADWYPGVEAQIVDALKEKKSFTTGWYGSKHEIANAKITYSADQEELLVEVSVSDDFDTKGCGDKLIPFTADLDTIREAIADAWKEAEENQKDNRDYAMWRIEKDGRWVETYLVDTSGFDLESPPGDSSHQWGWQEETVIPDDIKAIIEEGIHSYQEKIVSKNYVAVLSGSDD